MKVANNILEMIKNNREFRLKVALDSGIGEQGLQRAAERNSDSLTKLKTLKALAKHSGISLKNIVCEETQLA